MKKKIPLKENPEISNRRRANKNTRRGYLTAFIALIIFIAIGFSMINIVSLKMQEAEAAELKQKLLLEKEKLQSELSLVNDPSYIEQQARIKLSMIKPGETLYIFPDKLATEPAIEETTN